MTNWCSPTGEKGEQNTESLHTSKTPPPWSEANPGLYHIVPYGLNRSAVIYMIHSTVSVFVVILYSSTTNIPDARFKFSIQFKFMTPFWQMFQSATRHKMTQNHWQKKVKIWPTDTDTNKLTTGDDSDDDDNDDDDREISKKNWFYQRVRCLFGLSSSGTWPRTGGWSWKMPQGSCFCPGCGSSNSWGQVSGTQKEEKQEYQGNQ